MIEKDILTCKSLSSIDLIVWDVSNITDMNAVFRGCTSILSDEEMRRIEMKKKQELRLKKLKRILDEDDNK